MFSSLKKKFVEQVGGSAPQASDFLGKSQISEMVGKSVFKAEASSENVSCMNMGDMSDIDPSDFIDLEQIYNQKQSESKVAKVISFNETLNSVPASMRNGILIGILKTSGFSITDVLSEISEKREKMNSFLELSKNNFETNVSELQAEIAKAQDIISESNMKIEKQESDFQVTKNLCWQEMKQLELVASWLVEDQSQKA